MRLLNVTADTTGNDTLVRDGERHLPKFVQVQITGTATVKIQGRTNTDMPYVDLKTYTASGADVINLLPIMRAVASGLTGATVKVDLDASIQNPF